ncbi:MAG: hypothetical protein IID44_03760 [Planctomycetes bacterium]|nr:hypothetical protein [Planctomycetota bacterium]
MAQPEKTFRIGRCSASVFINTFQSNEGEKRTFRSVSLQRRYRDGDEWKTSTSFTLTDVPAAIAVLHLAMQHIASREADVGN